MPATATKERTKPSRVSDNPAYKAAVDKLTDLRSQHAAATKLIRELEPKLRTSSAGNPVETRAAAILAGRDVNETKMLTEQMQEARLQELALHRAVELQEIEVRRAQIAASVIIHEAEQPALDAKLTAVVEAIGTLFDRLDDLHAFTTDLHERGAPLSEDRFAGAFNHSPVQGHFRLPPLGAVASVREAMTEHWRKHYPQTLKG